MLVLTTPPAGCFSLNARTDGADTVDLQSLQESFGRAMLEGGDALAARVLPAGGLSGVQSVAVYRRNRNGALTRALREVYPVCAQLLGDARFSGIAAGYVRLYPSRDADLNHYGGRFAGFLRRYCEEPGNRDDRRLACLPDLARLERCYHDAHYAADDPPFDFEAFSRVGERDRGRIVLQASRALSLVSSDYPLLSIWRSRTYSGASGGERLCVHRDRLRPAIVRCPPTTYRLLEDIIKGEPLGVLSRRFARLDRDLPALVGKGWVSAFRLAPGTPR